MHMASLSREKSTEDEMSQAPRTPAADTTKSQTSQTRSTSRFILTISLVSLVVVSLFLFGGRISTSQRPTTSMSWDEDDIGDIGIDIPLLPLDGPYEPLKRYSLDFDAVACWSDGGLWMKSISAVEMAWLGVDRFQDTDRAESLAEEDAFCARFKMLGPTFWELPPQWPDFTRCSSIMCVPPTKTLNISTAFPANGGVWILDSESKRPDGQLPVRGGLRNALTMEERVDVIKDMGAYFCEDIDVCLKLVFERSDQPTAAGVDSDETSGEGLA